MSGKRAPFVTVQPETVSISPTLSSSPGVRRLVVAPVFEGQLPPGYRLTSYTVEPNTITLRGGSDLIARLSTIDTESISLTNLRRDRTTAVRLIVPDGAVLDGADTVTVTLKVGRG